MAICGNVGHSDSGKERPHLNELPAILQAFQFFEEHGKLSPSCPENLFLVPDLLTNNPTVRLDAQFFDPRYFATMDTLDKVAKEKGWQIESLRKLLPENGNPIAGGGNAERRILPG